MQSAPHCTCEPPQCLIKIRHHVTIRSIIRLSIQQTMKLSTLETVFHSLNNAGARYLVAGGVAVNIHGYQRMTVDLDLVIQLNSDNIKKAGRARDIDDIRHLQLITDEHSGQ